MAVVKRSIRVLTALTFIACFSLGQVTSHPVYESVHFKVWTDLLKTDHGNRTNKTIQIGMTWENCGPSDPIHANVEISPDPIPIPGKVKISFNATLDITCDAPLRLKLKIKKKILGHYWTIHCFENIGSCTYDDLCSIIPDQWCPKPFITYQIPCHCPFPKDVYRLPTSSFQIPAIPYVPDWLTSGKYKVTAHISRSAKEIACYEAAVSLKAD